jgi:hypothetical protein
MLAALQKKANNGVIPPWTISIYDEEEEIIAKPTGKKELKVKEKAKVHTLTTIFSFTNCLTNIPQEECRRTSTPWKCPLDATASKYSSLP